MILQGRNLTQGLTGADVAELHSELTQLGYTVPAAEQQSSQFGTGTLAAVEQFQTAQELTVNGTVDAAMAAALTTAIAASTYTVTGVVSSPTSAGMSGLTVQLVDKNVGGDVTVGTTTTGAGGAYKMSAVIGAPTLSTRHKTRPDLQVRVSSGSGTAPTFLAASSIAYDAPTTLPLNVTLPSSASGLPSEYETLTANLATLYTGPLRTLQESAQQQDITYLANKSGWDARTVAFAALADQFSQITTPGPPLAGSTVATTISLQPQFYYALFRAGLPSSADILFQTGSDTVQAIWQQAIAQGVIPPSLSSSVPTAVQNFQALSAAHTLTMAPALGPSTLQEMVAPVLTTASQQQQFALLLAQHRHDWTNLWPAVEKALGATVSTQMQFLGQLHYLTVNNAPLIAALNKAEAASPLSSPLDLATRGYYDAEKWTPLIGTSIPAGIPGSTADEKTSNYAELLAAQVRTSFPTAVLADQVKHGIVPIADSTDVANEVATFLAANQAQYTIGNEPIEAFIARTKVAAPSAPALAQIKRIHRTHQLTPDDNSMSVLLRHNLDSAYAITRYDTIAFVNAFQAELGGSARATALHLRARQIFNGVTNIATAYGNASVAPTLGGATPIFRGFPLPKPTNPVIAAATLEQLFGSLDYCDCSDCRSILSPAAYLTDLLNYLDQPSPSGGLQNPQDALFQRRPDLQYLPLTCENTNTALPYIDIVNETLEYFVANGLSLNNYQGHDTGSTVTSAELLASPQYVNDAAYTTLRNAFFPAPLPFNRPLELLRRHLQNLNIALPDAMIALRANDNVMNRTTPFSYGLSDILIEQLGISRDEYRLFTDPTLELGDLYGIPLVMLQTLSLQELSQRVAVSYVDLVAILQTQFINPAAALIPRLQRLNAPFTTLQTLHDNLNTPQSIVPQFIAALPAGLDATQYGGAFTTDCQAVVNWVTSPQVYPQIMGLITIANPSSGKDDCSGAALQLRYSLPDSTNTKNLLSATDFLKVIRFIRFWRKLQPLLNDDDDTVTIAETDAILTALYPAVSLPVQGANSANDATNRPLIDAGFAATLMRAGFLFQVMNRLSLSADAALRQLLACWAPIGTVGPNALYQSMFLTPTLLQQDPGGRTATVSNMIAAGDMLTTQINNVTVTHIVAVGESATAAAAAIAAAINAATTADQQSNLPLNALVIASSAANVVTIRAATAAVPFTLSCSIKPAGSYSAGSQVPPGYTLTINGTIKAGDVLTTTINGVGIPYTTVAADTTTTILAASIAAAINKTAALDPKTKLPIATLVHAAGNGNVVTINLNDPAIPVTIAGTLTAGAETFTVAGPVPASQTATVSGPISAGAILTTTITGLHLYYTVAAGDTPTTIAANIVKLINGSTRFTPLHWLRLQGIVSAASAGGVITITAANPAFGFTLEVSFGAATYLTGQSLPPFADNGYGVFLTDPTQTLFNQEPLLCAACNLTGAEFALITGALGFDATTPLTLANVTMLFRYGWLAHALNLSVLEFLRTREFSGLDPFAPLDPGTTAPAEPPIIRFIRLLQAMSTAGLEPVQALYQIWNQDISGTSAPAQNDINGLAVALRADFAVVDAQFVLQDDPSGSIAQGLMALVYGTAATDFFFGLLDRTFSVAVNYSHLAPVLPQPVINASGGLLSYDDLSKQLSFSGVLDSGAENAILAAAIIKTTDTADSLAAGAVTLTPASMSNIVTGTALLIDSGTAQERVVVTATNTTGFTTTIAKAHNGTATPFAIVNDPSFTAAIASLAAANQDAIAPFFATYPELRPLYTAYAASSDPIQTKRTSLLNSFLPTLKRIRIEQQALASITAAAGTDPSFATALLQDATILHADTDPTAATVTDLTAIANTGLSAQFFLSNNLAASADKTADYVTPVSYVQTATVSGTIAAGTVLTTTINGNAIAYTTTAADTTPAILAGNVAAAINGTTTVDAVSGLAINRLVSATLIPTRGGNLIAISGMSPMAANRVFSLACSVPAGTLSYTAGTQLPPGNGGGPIAGSWSGYITVPQDGSYNFAVVTDTGATVTLQIDNRTVPMGMTGGVWSNQVQVTLTAGALVSIVLTATSIKTTLALSWESPPGLGWQVIPGQYLYPLSLMQRLRDTYVRFLKATSLATALSLSASEIAWLGTNSDRTVNTTCAAAIAAGTVQFTLQSMANIAVGSVLVIDTGAAQETVNVTAVGTSTFTAVAAHAHDGSTTPFKIVSQAAPAIGRGWLNFLPGLPEPDLINAPVPDLATAASLGQALGALLNFSRIKQALSPNDQRLLQLLRNPTAVLPNGQTALISLTGWTQVSINALLRQFFNSTAPASLADVENFRRVYDAYQMVQSCRVSAPSLIAAVTNAPSANIVSALQSALRALYAESDWLTVVRPINDAVRILQRDALVAYILQGFSKSPSFNTIQTADQLFEYFLIDTQTQPPVETSRIVLALSSVQLFIERVIRNLETQVSPADINLTKWQWMKRYRVWQANRELFLWPENWLYPELRDDQSPIFQQMMSALLQSDITDDAAAEAYLDYLSNLEEVAKLEPCGIYYLPATTAANGASNNDDVSYVVARTAGANRKYYFRQFEGESWTPWTQVKIDCEDMPLTPIVWNNGGGNRLFLFWLKVLKQSPIAPGSLPQPDPTTASTPLTSAKISDLAAGGPSTSQAASQVNVSAVLCWSEFYNGKWQPTKTSEINRPASLGSFDPSGPGSFDPDRNLMRIMPAQYTGENPIVGNLGANFSLPPGALILQIIVNYDQLTGETIPTAGFVMYNTHSLPIRLEDLTVATASGSIPFVDLLDIPVTSRLVEPIESYTGANETATFGITYYDSATAAPAYTNKIVDYNWMPRLVEAQPGLPDAWDAPLLYEDRRNVFYVTTAEDNLTFQIYDGFETLFSISSRAGVTPRMPALAVKQSPVGNTNILAALGAKGSITYQGTQIKTGGSEIALGKALKVVR